ncbi:MAG: hypothetical protein AAFR18_09665 [Cyanobacteria bacterium J06627_32]
MTPPVQDRLYNLLPALYRLRDKEPQQAEALRALMALIEEQFLALEADVDQLYDDAFIETCQEWVVPYIGDLLGVKPLQSIAQTGYSQRAYVANTLDYRQRKGTVTVLEQLARDVTNWPARAVEYFQLMEWNQNINHIRPQGYRTPNLRDAQSIARLNGPFETALHTPEIRHISGPTNKIRGRYNTHHIGIHLWRLQAYPLSQVQARPVPNQPGLYWINPLGRALSLFNTPLPEAATTTLSKEINVPEPLGRRPLYDEVEALASGQPPQTEYFGTQPVFEVFVEGDAIAPSNLQICDLSGAPGAAGSSWQRPNTSRAIAIDPELGRLALPQAAALPEDITVSHAYGFSGDIGGGPYNRRQSVEEALSAPVTWQVGVSPEASAIGDEVILSELADAIAQWNAQPPGTIGAILLMENHSYEPGNAPIEIPAGSQLAILSARWPLVPSAEGGERRNLEQWVPIGRRAHVSNSLAVRGTAPSDHPNPGQLTLDGLLIDGRLTIEAGNLETVRIAHCTLVPDQGGLAANSGTNNRLTVCIDHSITGPLYLSQKLAALTINDSIVDGTAAGRIWISQPIDMPFPGGEFRVVQSDGTEDIVSLPNSNTLGAVIDDLAVAFQLLPGLAAVQVAQVDEGLEDRRCIIVSPVPLTFTATATDATTVDRLGLRAAPAAIASPIATEAAPITTLERTTVLGASYAQSFELASEVIWTETAIAQRRQTGCVRFSYVPPGSKTPRRYRCQPELENETQLELAEKERGSPLTAAQRRRIRDRVQKQMVPTFSDRRYGQPAYGQLSLTCPVQIRTGAGDSSEMGAFSFLKQPQREANLRGVLDDYLRFGLEAGLFFVT